MATLQDLQQAIDELLAHPLGAGNYQLVQNVAPKAYEAYVFGLCLRAITELGVTPLLQGISGAPAPFVFRGAPGQIHSTYRNYGYAAFSLNGEEFEIHSGVEFRGTSGVTHELDVAIMKAAVAQECRDNPADPASSSLVGGWECKFYSANLSKSLGRQFVGLVDDLSNNLQVKGMCSNVGSPQLKTFFKRQPISHPHFELTPLNPVNEQIFVGLIQAKLKKMTES